LSKVVHPIPPVFDEHSEILILGSFPSVKSREQCFFYGHPQNRFWKVIHAVVCGRQETVSADTFGRQETVSEEPAGGGIPSTVEEKKAFLLRNHIALWDVIASCEITGSSDATITDVTPNDLRPILSAAPIRKIICNGAKSYELYRKYIEPTLGIPAVKLPSTSPANAAWSVEKLAEEWGKEI